MIIDISLPIHGDMPIYPGNQVTELHKVTKPSGSQLTTVTLDSHAGTHIDGPSHAGLDGGVDVFTLETFYGPCRVIELLDTPLVTAQHLNRLSLQPGERVLFKTDNSLRGYDDFHDTWTALSSDAAAYLATQKVALVGIDWFGIKQKGAADNGAHTELLKHNIPILEGIDLSKVTPGKYTLAAFPLPYQGIDGAQCRAVLLPPQ